MKEAGVIEPQRVKKQAIQSAAEAAEMILRIDDMIASTGAKGPTWVEWKVWVECLVECHQ